MKNIPRTILTLGLVSLFTDISSEMIYPLLPVFLSQVLGTGAIALGLIEGIAESTSAFLRVISGIVTDRSGRRKPLIVAGYSVAGLARPLIGLAQSWQIVLFLRFTDRIGKGIRSSPRDALIADIAEPDKRGRAYGLHRAMDHAGAVAGPLVAGALLSIPSVNVRTVFLLAAIPAAIAFLLLVFFIHEPNVTRTEKAVQPSLGHWIGLKHFGSDYKTLMVALFIFTLGGATDAFILVRLAEAGVPAGWIATLWAFHNGVKMLTTYYGGKLSDRFGTRTLITAGWIYYSVVYLAFALAKSATSLILIFMIYGLHYGLVEPAERAWVVDLIPTHQRGTAFGYYHFIVGLASLPANLLFGLVWQKFSPEAAFLMAGGFAIIAVAILFFIPQRRT